MTKMANMTKQPKRPKNEEFQNGKINYMSKKTNQAKITKITTI